MKPITLTRFEDVRQAYRQRHLKQALFDAEGLVMKDTILVLHGEEHRHRRRLENRLFRREVFERYENELMPPAIASNLDAARIAGKCDLISTARHIVVNLTAQAAGIDQTETGVEQTERLYEQAIKFSEGATSMHSTRNPEELNVEIEDSFNRWEEEFFEPSLRRRQYLLEQLLTGEISEDDLPPDILMVLVRNNDELGLSRDVMRRETAFYLQAGMHSTVGAIAHAVHETFDWRIKENLSVQDLLDDKKLLQSCVHESMRLHPASPVAMREAVEFVELPGGIKVEQGMQLILDLDSANRDPEIFGKDAAVFNPKRMIPEHVEPWGHSFGGGVHKCIGMELDGGVPPQQDDPVLLFGTVGLVLEGLLERGAQRDLKDPPTLDPNTTRIWWGRYPLIFVS